MVNRGGDMLLQRHQLVLRRPARLLSWYTKTRDQ